jgi:hypothetical protein
MRLWANGKVAALRTQSFEGSIPSWRTNKEKAMKVLVPRDSQHDYPEDVETIQKAFFKQGFLVTSEIAEYAWHEYSGDMAAGWICLPEGDDEFIVRACMPYLKEG